MSLQSFEILLADDDEDDTFLFREALSQIPVSANLVVAENGMELMKKLTSSVNVPDIIFLDMNMPVKNGLECLTEIRQNNKLSKIPVVILSTSVADNLLSSAYKGGANLYIQKPTSFSSLISVIENCIRRKGEFVNAPGPEDFLIKNPGNK